MGTRVADEQAVRMHLLEIRPLELKFTFEVKKQSSCAVHLTNHSDQYVAFKVKTTSPKKYCVRPNIGIVKPKSTCDFTVTMQAQKSAPLDMQCKDKFLIQSTVAPFGISEEDIPPDLFAKDSGNYIDERKLKVILVSPPHSPVLSPANGITKQEHSYVISTQEEKLLSGAENLPPPQMLDKNIEDAKLISAKEELKSVPVQESVRSPSKSGEFTPYNGVEFEMHETVQSPPNATIDKDVEGGNMKLSEDIKELYSKFLLLDAKLIEAELTITRLKEEKTNILQEKEMLKRELATMKRKSGLKQVQQGFPPLFVIMVALISLAVGFWLHA